MIIGTETGCWYSIQEQPDGRVDFEFYRHDVKIDEGVAHSHADAMMRFHALDRAAALPLQ